MGLEVTSFGFAKVASISKQLGISMLPDITFSESPPKLENW